MCSGEDRKSNVRSQSLGNCLAVWWLGLHASTAGSMGLIPGQGMNIPHAALHSQTKKSHSLGRGICLVQENTVVGNSESSRFHEQN